MGIQPLQFLYLGSRHGMDCELVRRAGLLFYGIFSGKWRRYADVRNLTSPFLILIGFLQAMFHIIRFWPHVVFSTGGYVGFPVALAAWILRRPLILHESDAIMGLANRFTAKLADRICLGFPGTKTLSAKTVFTGNPFRAGIMDGRKEEGYAITGFNPEKPVLLVWGGSQGAQEINHLVEINSDKLVNHFQIIHVTGKGKKTAIQNPFYKFFEYIGDELPHIYAITDFVVGRAGANSLYELAALQKPNIIIPLLGAANCHQACNAEYFEAHGASMVLRGPADFADTIIALWNNPEQREKMKKSLADLARPDAAKHIAHLILEL